MLPAGEAGPKVDMDGSDKSAVHHWAHPPCTTARQVNLHGQYLQPSCSWLHSCQCHENRDPGKWGLSAAHQMPASSTEARASVRHLGPEVDIQHSR